MVKADGYELSNVDCTIIAQKPKMAPYIEAMRERIAALLEVNISQVNVKATTTEKLGFTGREEGIAAQAAVLVYQK
jgi:2-C-methyl-D-erythritol 2,4-cyclodiphosphate synthase